MTQPKRYSPNMWKKIHSVEFEIVDSGFWMLIYVIYTQTTHSQTSSFITHSFRLDLLLLSNGRHNNNKIHEIYTRRNALKNDKVGEGQRVRKRESEWVRDRERAKCKQKEWPRLVHSIEFWVGGSFCIVRRFSFSFFIPFHVCISIHFVSQWFKGANCLWALQQNSILFTSLSLTLSICLAYPVFALFTPVWSYSSFSMFFHVFSPRVIRHRCAVRCIAL